MASTPTIPFLEISDKAQLADHLGITVRVLTGLAYSKPMRTCSTFFIPKKNGSRRKIDAPNPHLKKIQRLLNAEFEKIYSPPPCVHGFTPHRSIVTNAQKHAGHYAILSMDIKDFFPSITGGRVYGLFLKEPFCFPEDVAKILTKLVTINDSFPQGGPTSPIISNFICWRMDKQLIEYAESHHVYYTRYADDITFSSHSRRRFNDIVRESTEGTTFLDEHLTDIINKNGFEINDDKTHVARKGSRQIVTNVIVNEKCNLYRSDYRELRAVLYRWSKDGIESAAKYYASHLRSGEGLLDKEGNVSTERFRRHIRGRLDYYDMICKGSSCPSVPMMRLWSSYHYLTGERVPRLLPGDSIVEIEYYDSTSENFGYSATAFISSDHRLHTCAHCIPDLESNAENIEVTSHSKKKSTIDICRFKKIQLLDYASADIALDEIDNSGLTINRNYHPKLDEEIFAYGYAENKRQLERQQASIMCLENDGTVVVNRPFIEGMSGGPVFNTRGEVIGIVTKGSGSEKYIREGEFLLFSSIDRLRE